MEHLYLPKRLNEIITPNKDIIINNLHEHIENNTMNLLIIGSTNTFKSKLIYLLVDEYYKRIRLHNYSHLVMNVNCFMDIIFSNTINEIKTFCKTTTNSKKFIIIDNFDIINETNQQYLKLWMDNCKNTFFIFGCENTNKISEIIQTRVSPIYLDDLNKDNYNEMLSVISQKEHIVIDNINVLLEYKNISIYFIFNLFNKLKLLNKTHVTNIIPYISLIDYTIFTNYFYLVQSGDIKQSISLLMQLFDKGNSLIDIYHSLYEYVKLHYDENKYVIIEQLCLYIQYIYDGFDNKVMLMFFTNDLISIYKNIKK